VIRATQLEHGLGQVPRAKEFEVLLGMLRAIRVYGRERGIQHCYLLVTDSFARLLRRLGVVLYQVGRAVDHRGYRTPYLVRLEESAASMCGRSPVVRGLFARDALGYRSSGEIDEDTIDPDSLLIEPMVAAA
jgi:N-acyl amino acid synthase of PEP-CTERM/exosortase system